MSELDTEIIQYLNITNCQHILYFELYVSKGLQQLLNEKNDGQYRHRRMMQLYINVM